MAELLVGGGGVVSSPLGTYLREALPDDYVVVADPVVQRCALDAVVVGPAGFTILRLTGDGVRREEEDLVKDAQHARRALGAFLRDEFPGLRAPIRYLAVRHSCDDPALEWQVLELTAMKQIPLAEAIAPELAPPVDAGAETHPAPTDIDENGDLLADADVREDLAEALRDRELTVSMRAAKPFVFRTGGALGSGTSVWTIRDAVAHMRRHPDDGIYHLSNGTLAAWLAEEGAEHLAQLAHETVRQTKTDRRMALETFLIGTGLVERPKVKLSPAVVDLGYVLAGESTACRLRVAQGNRRGFLFGTLESRDAWLHVEPHNFAGEKTELVVRADSALLPVGRAPQAGQIILTSNAAADPAAVPVRVRVVGIPSPLQRYIMRPILALALAALIGTAAGLCVLLAGGIPAWPAADPLLWVWSVAVFGALCGLVRGFFQPLAWPVGHAAKRWLLRTAAWAAGLALLAVSGLLYWGAFYGPQLAINDRLPLVAAVAWALALAPLPATLHEIRANQGKGSLADLTAPDPQGRRKRQIVRLAVLGLAIIAMLAAPPLLRPAWQAWQAAGATAAVQQQATDGWSRLNQAADNLYRQYYLRTYDRRAPLGTPALTATPAPTEGQADQP
jgi:hypothetical protein